MFRVWMIAIEKFEDARSLTYGQFVSKFVYDKRTRSWKPRKKGFTIDKLIWVPPTTGELFFLRIMLTVVKGPTTYEDIRKVLATILTLWLADKSGHRLLLIVMVIAFSLGLGAMPWIIMSEILPINIKGLAGSFATLANWFFSWLVTLTANLLLDWSSGGTFTIYTAVCVFTAGFVAIWVPETKGKTLEEIQQFFR
ncbi:hypothetical protein KIW84_062747 [Lathyrus oleraceus]|uniref:Major facilitator superfamily (MFS) profile domain-containing protein n=1 Tax=Pisum sativum TaxID=3888 RepID=A0A9D5A8Q5_PEA|nr:hypothetical protein KIW84_062747 [Pisum sativum]